MPAKPRIAFVINSLAGGGAERVMTVLLAASRARLADRDICLVLLDDEPAAYRAPDWLEVHQLDARGSLLRSIRALAAFLRGWRPDATLSFLTRANLATVATARVIGHKAVISERVNSSAHFGGGAKATISKALVRLAYPRADHVITVSQGVTDDLAANFAMPRARMTAIDNPVDLAAIASRAAELPENAVAGDYLVAVGRMTRTKNHRLLLDAFARSGIAARLLLLGEGPERAALEAQVAALGLGGRVLMPGFVANPFALIARAIGYVSASNGEGFPNGLVEAMAAGLPVISTNCASGPAEILAEQPRDAVAGLVRAPHGVLVPTDDAAALAAAMQLFEDAGLRRDYADRARRRVADFSVEAAERRYWAVIDAALEHR